MTAARRSGAEPEHDVHVPAGFTVVAEGDVANAAQYLALLADGDLAVSLIGEVEPADRRLREGARAVNDATLIASRSAKPVIVEDASSPGSRISTKVRSPAPSARSLDFIDCSRSFAF
jgi:hypothetical protein